MDCSVGVGGAVTATAEPPAIEPIRADITAVPAETAVTRPALLTVAAGESELQMDTVVTFAV
jgi:hypothetical protein